MAATINHYVSYADFMSAINEGVSVSSNGQVLSVGTPEQIAARQEKLRALRVILNNVSTDETEGRDYMLGIAFDLENAEGRLDAVPRIGVVYKEGDTYRRLVSIDQIPTRWLTTLVNVRERLKAWRDGSMLTYRDAWPIGFELVE